MSGFGSNNTGSRPLQYELKPQSYVNKLVMDKS